VIEYVFKKKYNKEKTMIIIGLFVGYFLAWWLSQRKIESTAEEYYTRGFVDANNQYYIKNRN
jgi:hypothetical protein